MPKISDEEEDMDDGADGVLNWGGRKNAYYHGDTADLEIGQEEDDADLEEEAGREVLRERLKDMDEGDFLMSGDEGEEDDEGTEKEKKKKKKRGGRGAEEDEEEGTETLRSAARRPDRLSKLSRSDRIRILRSDHPELMPLVEHFRDGPVSELAGETRAALGALLGTRGGDKDSNGEIDINTEDAEVSLFFGRMLERAR